MEWDEINKLNKIRLYAGDIPVWRSNDNIIGISINSSDNRHVKHDLREDILLNDCSVDSFQSEDVFEHIELSKLPNIINEIYRILKYGGIFRLSTPDYNSPVMRQRAIYNDDGIINGDTMGGGHLWFPVINDIINIVDKTDFYVNYLQYWIDKDNFVFNKIDISIGKVQRTPDFDIRVKNIKQPLSIVVDMIKIL